MVDKDSQFYRMFVYNLRDVYSAEKQFAEKVPELIEAISSDELRNEVQAEFRDVKRQSLKLEEIFNELDESPEGVFCEGMQGLLNECIKEGQEDLPGPVKDAALISEIQKVKHYEIASYGALRTFAKHLKLKNTQEVLQEMLDDEWNVDQVLTNLAEGGYFKEGINATAAK